LAPSNHPMPKRHSSASWITFTLILATALLLRPCPATAERLLDVRIGEYDDYTRVVFEVDTPFAQPRIDIGAKGQLWVDFDHTAVQLVRKIPVKRSRHIDNILFWQHDGHLSTVIKLNYPRYRFKTFSLDTPPRVAVDIYPEAVPAGDSQAATAAAKSPEAPTPEVPLEKNIPRQASPQEPPPDAPPDKVDQIQPSERPDSEQAESAQSRPADISLVEAKPQTPIAHASGSDQETMPAPVRSTPQSVFRLQFFLVIGLVVITIGILFLLLMMLFARHRFSKVKSKLRASDFLQDQDKKIEAIDERIKEQIERYEKA
jgi:hypothetical protein